MHEHVTLSMRGILGCNDDDTAAADDEYGNDNKVAICPVSTRFYELLRNTQGVIRSADDGGEQISYCPLLSSLLFQVVQMVVVTTTMGIPCLHYHRMLIKTRIKASSRILTPIMRPTTLIQSHINNQTRLFNLRI